MKVLVTTLTYSVTAFSSCKLCAVYVSVLIKIYYFKKTLLTQIFIKKWIFPDDIKIPKNVTFNSDGDLSRYEFSWIVFNYTPLVAPFLSFTDAKPIIVFPFFLNLPVIAIVNCNFIFQKYIFIRCSMKILYILYKILYT